MFLTSKKDMNIKIFSLNLKEYENWNERISKISAEICNYKPDIIVFQEVVLDKRFSSLSTLEQLNKKLNYPYFIFAPCFDYSLDYGKGSLQKESVIGGLGILSKISFDSFVQDLPIVYGVDRRPRKALICDFGNFTLANVHFSNKSFESRELQRKEIKKTDIIVGDFNTLPDELEVRLSDKNYKSSYEYIPYISYPYNGMTLDYCIIKKGKFTNIICIDKNISDHVAMFYDIEL